MATTVKGHIDSRADNIKLTGRTEEVLLAIAVALKELGPHGLTRSELARRMGLNPSTITRHVDRLLNSGFIETSSHSLQLTLDGESRVMKLIYGK